jgi:hypothetical protein
LDFIFVFDGPSAVPAGQANLFMYSGSLVVVDDANEFLSIAVPQGYTGCRVPEIDITSIAGVFPLVMASLALLERRRRRPIGEDCVQANN